MMDSGLYEKYLVPEDQGRAPLTPLSFILRKAEMSINLAAAEWQWLEKRQLTAVIEIIKSQENYRRALAEEIRSEVLQLRLNKFVSRNILSIPDANSERTLVLYKVHNLEELDQDEQRFVDDSYKEARQFAELKTRLGIVEDVPRCDTSTRILSQIADGNNLASADLEYLSEKCIISAFDVLSPFFSGLCEKYRIPSTEGGFSSQTRSQVHIILQKLDENKLISEAERQVLEATGCNEALEFAGTIELSILKEKFYATQIEGNSPKQHLYKVLKKLEAGLPLPEADLNYLVKRKLHDTVVLELERKIDRGLSQDEIAWCKRHGQEDMVFRWLKKEFNVAYRDDKLDGQLYPILLKLKAEQRLDDKEILWLDSENWLYRRGESLWWNSEDWFHRRKSKIYKAHHRLEALFCEDEFKRTQNHWLLASGSAHWRKAEDSTRALSLTELDITKLKEPKLRQALLTTRGGALRDLGRLEEAEQCALNAIKHYSLSHNPYTLMGALCYDTRRYEEGYLWFEKARERGATTKEEDTEIKRILSKNKDQDLIAFLLGKDPIRYAWVEKYKSQPKPGATKR